MDGETNLDCDVLIMGGGVAGLWLLDDLRRQNARALLLESQSLGDGQTSYAQGILHGGTRYALSGLLSASAKAVRSMPAVWQSRLDGVDEPNLSAIRYRAPWCALWRNDTWQSRLGMLGAKVALEVRPVALPQQLRPAPLIDCPGQVYRLDEPVIDPISFLEIMRTRNQQLLWKIDTAEFQVDANHQVRQVVVQQSQSDRRIAIRPGQVVLLAGAGNENLRQQIGLPGQRMQRRPLHVIMLRGELPSLNGHCVDRAHTRITVTSATDSAGRTVWQLGGQVSEDGVCMEPAEMIQHARKELVDVLPGWQLPQVEWATARVDRAEGRTGDGSRPDDVQLLAEGNVITAWPTKLVLAPLLAQRVRDKLNPGGAVPIAAFQQAVQELHWPTPHVAQYPWERPLSWTQDN